MARAPTWPRRVPAPRRGDPTPPTRLLDPIPTQGRAAPAGAQGRGGPSPPHCPWVRPSLSASPGPVKRTLRTHGAVAEGERWFPSPVKNCVAGQLNLSSKATLPPEAPSSRCSPWKTPLSYPEHQGHLLTPAAPSSPCQDPAGGGSLLPPPSNVGDPTSPRHLWDPSPGSLRRGRGGRPWPWTPTI